MLPEFLDSRCDYARCGSSADSLRGIHPIATGQRITEEFSRFDCRLASGLPVNSSKRKTLFNVQVISRRGDIRGSYQLRCAILSGDGNRRVDSL